MNFEEFARVFTEQNIPYVKIGKKYYEESSSLKKTREVISKNPENTGLILGEEKNNFLPSTYFLEKLSLMTKNKVFINDKAEWLFLCGRDAFENSITKNNSSAKFFLVQNQRDENLGLGTLSTKNGVTIVKNVSDRGDFLRREK